MKNVLITGASGYFGQKLVSCFDTKNEVERIYGIDIKPPAFHSPKLEFIECDVRDDLKEVYRGRNIDCVIHAAYILPQLHDVALMEDININGTKNVFNSAAHYGVKQIMDCSSTTAYGFHPDNPPVLTEESPLRGNEDFTYGKNKRELEAWAKQFEKAYPDISLIVIRPCFVVGPGFANPMARYFCKKTCVIPRKTSPMQFIHEDDLVELMYLLLKKNKPGIYNLTADGTMPIEDMVSILGGRVVKMPAWLLGSIIDLGWYLRMTSITESSSSSMKLMQYSWVASNQKIKKELGYQFKYATTRSAFEDFARHMKTSGSSHA